MVKAFVFAYVFVRILNEYGAGDMSDEMSGFVLGFRRVRRCGGSRRCIARAAHPHSTSTDLPEQGFFGMKRRRLEESASITMTRSDEIITHCRSPCASSRGPLPHIYVFLAPKV